MRYLLKGRELVYFININLLVKILLVKGSVILGSFFNLVITTFKTPLDYASQAISSPIPEQGLFRRVQKAKR